MNKNKVFLTGRWSKLVMVNYLVDPNLLQPFIPNHTELDLYNGNCYISLVGFLFEETRLKGVRVPCHVKFEEVNLRFYVKYNDGIEWKRGVVFIKEIVPKPALTLIANLFFNEHYETLPMKHEWLENKSQISITYSWKSENWNSMKILVKNNPTPIMKNSEEEFITEHYWGYTKINETTTSEYQVEHSRWDILPLIKYELKVNFEETYGSHFACLNHLSPHTVFVAEGSEITVRSGSIIS